MTAWATASPAAAALRPARAIDTPVVIGQTLPEGHPFPEVPLFRHRALAPAALMVLVLLVPATGVRAIETVPAGELARGDTLTGLTVLSPEGVREFRLVVVGVIEGSAPGRDLIVAEALGETLEETGIVQGMSGSPVYRDGRLVGAVSAAWSFSKKPMAAVTPIESMLALAEEPDAGLRSDAGSGLLPELIPEGERTRSRAALLASRAVPDAPRWAAGGHDDVLGTFEGRDIVGLGVPLTVPGSAGYRERVTPYLRRLGFLPVAAAGVAEAASVRGSGEAPSSEEIGPGSPIGVQFVGGDLRWSATGTVTHREGDTVLAFGHPLFEIGPTSMPLVSASVLGVVPLQSVSFRLTATGESVGRLVRDGASGVVGVLGERAPTMPVALSLSGPGFDTVYDFDVVAQRPYSFLFTSLTVGSAVSEVYRTTGRASVRLEITVETDSETVSYRDVLDTGEPALRVGGELAALLNALGDSPLAERRIESVNVRAEFSEGWGWHLIERVSALRPVVRPGEDIDLLVTLRPWRGETVTRRLSLPVPASALPGKLVVRVGGASEYHEWDAERLGAGAAPRTYAQLVRLVESSRPGNQLVAQALSERRSVTLVGSELESLPGRAALAMGAGGAGGSAVVLGERPPGAGSGARREGPGRL